MIIKFILDVIVVILSSLFYFFEPVTTLPSLFGYDLDGTLVTSVSYLNRALEVIWPVKYMLLGFLFIMTYYITKSGLKIFLGSRNPGN